jgi:NAD(P)H-dependent flavin oxidoreductase YrpB (nitropropane dioxygenase family)
LPKNCQRVVKKFVRFSKRAGRWKNQREKESWPKVEKGRKKEAEEEERKKIVKKLSKNLNVFRKGLEDGRIRGNK